MIKTVIHFISTESFFSIGINFSESKSEKKKIKNQKRWQKNEVIEI